MLFVYRCETCGARSILRLSDTWAVMAVGFIDRAGNACECPGTSIETTQAAAPSAPFVTEYDVVRWVKT